MVAIITNISIQPSTNSTSSEHNSYPTSPKRQLSQCLLTLPLSSCQIKLHLFLQLSLQFLQLLLLQLNTQPTTSTGTTTDFASSESSTANANATTLKAKHYNNLLYQQPNL